MNSARYTQRIIQTVKSREVEIISRPEEIDHDTGTGMRPVFDPRARGLGGVNYGNY